MLTVSPCFLTRGTSSKQKDREAAKKAIESALLQFESDPFEAGF